MNKKGYFSNLMLIILGFALIGIAYFFGALLLFESGGEYLISPTSDIGRDIIGQNTVASVNASVSQTITEVENSYLNFNFPFDLFFFVMLIITFSTTVWLAFKVNKDGIFEFFGYLFIGSLVLLLVTAYTNDFTSWFLAEIFYKVFADSLISMPIFMFYLNNLGLINFVWWLVLILVNIIDRNIISRTGEVEE